MRAALYPVYPQPAPLSFVIVGPEPTIHARVPPRILGSSPRMTSVGRHGHGRSRVRQSERQAPAQAASPFFSNMASGLGSLPRKAL